VSRASRLGACWWDGTLFAHALAGLTKHGQLSIAATLPLRSCPVAVQMPQGRPEPGQDRQGQDALPVRDRQHCVQSVPSGLPRGRDPGCAHDAGATLAGDVRGIENVTQSKQNDAVARHQRRCLSQWSRAPRVAPTGGNLCCHRSTRRTRVRRAVTQPASGPLAPGVGHASFRPSCRCGETTYWRVPRGLYRRHDPDTIVGATQPQLSSALRAAKPRTAPHRTHPWVGWLAGWRICAGSQQSRLTGNPPARPGAI
jgi:hypothetical protein